MEFDPCLFSVKEICTLRGKHKFHTTPVIILKKFDSPSFPSILNTPPFNTLFPGFGKFKPELPNLNPYFYLKKDKV